MQDLPPQPLHRTPGRAAGSNPDVRFDKFVSEAIDDGWAHEEDLPVLRTEVRDEIARTVISRNTSPDLSFDRSINPYRGCEHGCIYCFARPSHAFLGLSPGLDFETKLIARPNAAAQLHKELSNPGYIPRIIAIGTNTDSYQPIEKKSKIMREVMAVLADFNHPVGIVTKGTLVERDIDILAPMAAKGLLRIGVSITTLDPKTARLMEPRVPAPKARLQTIKRLTDAGIPVRVMVSPVFQHSPIMSWRRFWMPQATPVQSRHHRSSCVSRARWHRCFKTGWKRISLIAPDGSWAACASCTAAKTTIPLLANA